MHFVQHFIGIYIFINFKIAYSSICSFNPSSTTETMPPTTLILTPSVQQPSSESPNSITVPIKDLPNWNQAISSKPINNQCSVDASLCNETFNSFTQSNCQNLLYYNLPVCGGLLCFFNQQIGKCDGQCRNTILETCVSQVEKPSKDSDCICGSSLARFTSDDIPTCDSSNCFENSCSFAYVSINRLKVNTLYGFCNNEKVNLI
jgi:hypothetical protein